MTIRAIIVDIGGVLELAPGGGEPAERHDVLVSSWEQRLSMKAGALGAVLDALDEAGTLGTCSESAWRARLRDATGMCEGDLAAFMDASWDLYLGEFNHVLADWLRGCRPAWRTALLSNSFVGARERERDRHGMDLVADTIVYSHEEGVAKPDPRIYRVACERLGVAPGEALFLDDVPAYVEGARVLGMHAVLFTDTASAINVMDGMLNRR